MEEKVTILSAAQYFDRYAVNGIGKGMDRMMVKKQLIDAFHKEIFGLVALRCKKRFDDIPKDGDPEAMRIAKNVIRDATKKWASLIKMFEKYRETSGLLCPDDLKIDVEEEAKDDEDIPEDAVITDEHTMQPVTKEEQKEDGEISYQKLMETALQMQEEGKTLEEIAWELDIDEPTLRWHMEDYASREKHN